MPSKQNPVSSAGIVVDAATGERHVPSSTRSDGSKRREIRIRPGYQPPEDVEVYKNRTAEAWKNRGSGGVPGAEGLEGDRTPMQSGISASNKNAKRREARRRAKDAAGANDALSRDAASGDAVETDALTHRGDDDNVDIDSRIATGQQAVMPFDTEVEKAKKARNLKKKLKQARELRDKKDKGESLLPEQLEKVIKIRELIRQLETLGFVADVEVETN